MKTKLGRYVTKRFLITLFVISMVLLFGVSTGSILFRTALTHTAEYNIEQRMLAVGKLASQLTTLDELKKYRSAEDMNLPSYQELRRKLLEFSREYNVLYVYYMRKSGDRQLQYIVDNDWNEKTRVGLDTPPHDLRTDPWIEVALEGKASHAGLGNYTPGWEGLLTAYTPLFDRDGNVGAIAGVDILDEFIVFSQRMFVVLPTLQIIIMVLVFASGFITLLRYRIEAQKAFEASAAKSVFLSNMSHEFRTPLNIVLGMGELIRRTEDVRLIQSYADEIMVAGENLLSMVDELIEYSNSEKSKRKS
jgi:signal transduction histidine kinase